MTDDTIPMPTGEEPAKTEIPAVDEMPTAVIQPVAPDYATQTMATAVPADEFSTTTMTTPEVNETTQVLPIDAQAAAAPTMPATQQAAPAPVYNQFNAPTETVQSAPYPGTQPQSGDPTVFAAAPYSAQPGQPLPTQGAYAQYPAQPGQPGLPYPGEAPVPVAKKRRPLLWVAIVVIVLLLVGAGTAFAIVSHIPTNTPTQALQQYCHGLTTLNAQETYDTLSAASKEKTSLAQLQQGFSAIQSLGSFMKFSKCTVSNVQQNGSTATGQVELTTTIAILGISTSNSTPMPVQLVLENNTWKIDVSNTNGPNITIPTMPAFPTPTAVSN